MGSAGWNAAKLIGKKLWQYLTFHPIKLFVVASVSAMGSVFASPPLIFAFERSLLKARIQLGLLVDEREKWNSTHYYQETSSYSKLKKIISPEGNFSHYYLVTGIHGIGKSSAAKRAADELNHQGIIYVDVPESGDPVQFEEVLARKLFLYHLVHDKEFVYSVPFIRTIFLDVPPYDGSLTILSKQYRRWHNGNSIVIVIDQVNNFLVDGGKQAWYLDYLQDFAKRVSDERSLKVVFISSDGKAFDRMLQRSAGSRAILEEFPEATDEESLQYLENRLGEEAFKEHKTELIDLVKNYVGGQFTRLDQVNQNAENIDGMPLFVHSLPLPTVLRKHYRLQATSALNKLFLRRESGDKKAERMLVIANHILEHGCMDGELVLKEIEGIMDEDELKKSNIFCYHHSTLSYSFIDRATLTVYKVISSWSVSTSHVTLGYVKESTLRKVN